jgi:hypothetical protein
MPRRSNRAAAATSQNRRRRQAMTVENTTPQFDERAVEQIRASLPKGIDQRRLDLPRVLNEWKPHRFAGTFVAGVARDRSRALRPAIKDRNARK